MSNFNFDFGSTTFDFFWVTTPAGIVAAEVYFDANDQIVFWLKADEEDLGEFDNAEVILLPEGLHLEVETENNMTTQMSHIKRFYTHFLPQLRNNTPIEDGITVAELLALPKPDCAQAFEWIEIHFDDEGTPQCGGDAQEALDFIHPQKLLGCRVKANGYSFIKVVAALLFEMTWDFEEEIDELLGHGNVQSLIQHGGLSQ